LKILKCSQNVQGIILCPIEGRGRGQFPYITREKGEGEKVFQAEAC